MSCWDLAEVLRGADQTGRLGQGGRADEAAGPEETPGEVARRIQAARLCGGQCFNGTSSFKGTLL